MRGWFGNTFGGKLALYSLGVVALLVIGASSFFVVGVLGGEDKRVDRAVSPTVGETQAPEKTAQSQAEKDAAKKEAEAKKADEEAAKKKAEEEAAKKKAEEEAAKRAEEQAAADAAAAGEQAAADAAAAEVPPIDAVPPTDSSMLSLTVPKMGRYNDLVANDMSEATLDQGAGKYPSSGFPWEPGSNTYIAAHVLGWEGTNSWLQFANLPNMTQGDMIYLTGSDGTVYTYQVNEILTVTPYDVWVADPVPGRDMVSLQTCIGENYETRLIVRGDRVA